MLTRPLPLGGLLAVWFLTGFLTGVGFITGLGAGFPIFAAGLLLIAWLILRSSAGPPGWLMGLAGVGAGFLALVPLVRLDALGRILLVGGGSAFIVGAAGCLFALKARARVGIIEPDRR